MSKIKTDPALPIVIAANLLIIFWFFVSNEANLISSLCAISAVTIEPTAPRKGGIKPRKKLFKNDPILAFSFHSQIQRIHPYQLPCFPFRRICPSFVNRWKAARPSGIAASNGIVSLLRCNWDGQEEEGILRGNNFRRRLFVVPWHFGLASR